jgi:hypothetical protein
MRGALSSVQSSESAGSVRFDVDTKYGNAAINEFPGSDIFFPSIVLNKKPYRG